MIASFEPDAAVAPSEPVDDVVGMALELVVDRSSAIDAPAPTTLRPVRPSVASLGSQRPRVTSPAPSCRASVGCRGTRFPRLGGVLHGRVADDAHTAALVMLDVTETVRAGYLAALATEEVAAEPVQIVDRPRAVGRVRAGELPHPAPASP